MIKSATTPSKQGFFTRRSNIKGRLDAEFNYARLTIRLSSQYPQSALRTISSSRTGGTPSKAVADYWNGDIPWASPKDFGHFYLEDTEDHITQAAVTDSSTSVVPKGSVLFVFRSGILQHTMPVAVAKRAMAINQDVKAFTFDRSIMPEYAAAYFTIFGSRLLPLITKSGATVQSINTEQLEQLTIPIPPLAVQKQIIDELLSAFQAKRSKELQGYSLLRTIDEVLLDELGIKLQPEPPNTIEIRMFFRSFSSLGGSRIDPASNWKRLSFAGSKFPLRKLRAVVSINPPTQFANLDQESEVSFVPMDSVSDRFGEIAERQTRPIKGSGGYTTFLEGDLIWAKITPCMENGKSAIARNLLGGCGFGSTEFHVFRPVTSEIYPLYLHHLLRLQVVRKNARLNFTGTSGHQRVDEQFFHRLEIPLPPIPIQKKIAIKTEDMKNQARKLLAEAAVELEKGKRKIETLILGEGGEL